MENKTIFILEGPDASGKSDLSKHIQTILNGKCHIIHSNYSKYVDKNNHRRQHKLISKFVAKQFKTKNYTGNSVILDRCYISDITYGCIGYGSKGSLKSKLRFLDKYFKILTKNKNIKIFLIYCNHSNFNPENKDELINHNENTEIKSIYDNLFNHNFIFQEILNKYSIILYKFDYTVDSNYKYFDLQIER